MVKLTPCDTGLKVEQFAVAPFVYLDHWALRELSESDSLRERLVGALRTKNGTLAISWLNLIEFSKVTIPEEAEKAEQLIDAIRPQLFLLNPNFEEVIAQEDLLLSGGKPFAPHADLQLLEVLVKSNIERSALDPLTTRNLLRIVQTSGLSAAFDSLGDRIVDRLQDLRLELDQNVALQSGIRKLPHGSNIQRGTRYVLRELVRSFLVDKQIKISRNHAIDLSHAVVAVSYCDFVMLDGHWEDQVARAGRRLSSAKHAFPLASVFSKKNCGIDRFLQAVGSYGH